MYWEVIGNHMQGVKKADQICCVPPVGITGVVKSQILWFWFLSLLLLILELLNVLRENRNLYTGNQES